MNRLGEIRGDGSLYSSCVLPSAASLFLYHYQTMSTDPSQPSHGKFKKAMHGGSRHSLFYLSDPPPPPRSPLPEQQPLTESPPCQQTTSTNPPPNEPDDHTSHENTHENTPDSETTIPSNHTGPAQEYLVKTIRWVDFHTREAKDVRIITQNGNKGLACLNSYICVCQDTEM